MKLVCALGLIHVQQLTEFNILFCLMTKDCPVQTNRSFLHCFICHTSSSTNVQEKYINYNIKRSFSKIILYPLVLLIIGL